MKLFRRGAAAGLGLALVAFMGLGLPAVPSTSSAASATGTAFYAYAGGGAAKGVSNCPDTTTQADQCTLAEALGLAGAGDTVYLATPGTSALYIGNWYVGPKGTSASEPLTIEPAPGVTDGQVLGQPSLPGTDPTLDGDGSNAGTCQTGGCYGPVLTIGDAYVVIDDITIQDADNEGYNPNEGGEGAISPTAGQGGAIDNSDGGTLTVDDCSFYDNTSAAFGGAIGNGVLGGTGALTVTGSSFFANSAVFSGGGAIANGDDNGSGDVTVSDSTFAYNESVLGDGGAIDNGDYSGNGNLIVTATTFSGNEANDFGSAIAARAGTVTVAADIFSGAAALCSQGGTWADDGYNVASDASCFSSTPASTDNDSAGGGLGALIGPVFGNSGPTYTFLPLPGNPAIGIIPADASPITVGAGSSDPTVTLCPTTDQRGVASTPGQACAAGSVQVGLPVAQDQAYSTTEGTELTETAGTLQAGVVDDNPGTRSWTAQLVSPPSDGSVVVNPDGSFAYTPGAGFVGTDSFTYTLTDNLGFVSAPATVTIYVGPVFSISVNGSSSATTTSYGSPVDLGESGVPPNANGQMGFVAGSGSTTLCMLAFPTMSTGCPSSVNLAPGPYTVSANLTSTAASIVATSVNTVLLTVDPATLTVTASSATMAYGAAVPVITPSYSGFVDGQGVSSLTTAPTCSTTATPSSPPGSYPSTCTGAVDPDYSFNYVAGAVTVSPPPADSTSPAPTTTPAPTTAPAPPATTATAPAGTTTGTTVPPTTATTTTGPSTTLTTGPSTTTTTGPSTTTRSSSTTPPATSAPPTTSVTKTTSSGPGTAAQPSTAPPTTTPPAPGPSATVASPTTRKPAKKHTHPSTVASTTTTPPSASPTPPTTAPQRVARTSLASPATSTSTPTTMPASPKTSSAKTTTSSTPAVATTPTTVAKPPAPTATTPAPRTTGTVPPTTTPMADPGVLAYTGFNAEELVGFASALALLGCALALVSTRRRRNL
jgi:hypothetical protein